MSVAQLSDPLDVGMRVKCSKCKGTGDMGVIASCRCRVCGGSGYLQLDDAHEALYEWLEGYLDPDTDDEWLEDQLRRLMERRAKIIKSSD